MKKLLIPLLLLLMITVSVMASADELSLGEINTFLNNSAKLGEGSKANQVAVIPFSHIDGPKEEDLFYAFVPFKYVARNYIKYQVTFISCTCRSADVNLWSTAYVELSLPSAARSRILKSAHSALTLTPPNIIWVDSGETATRRQQPPRQPMRV
jgi:hypothetical protein